MTEFEALKSVLTRGGQFYTDLHDFCRQCLLYNKLVALKKQTKKQTFSTFRFPIDVDNRKST